MGTVALLGRRFMRDFNYRYLPQDDFTFGAVAYVDKTPAGFIVATPDAGGFSADVLRRYWRQLLWVLSSSVLLNPARWKAAIWAWRLFSKRPALQILEPVGEILTVGVLPEYRDAGFVRKHGIRIGGDLLDVAITGFRARGVKVFRACVESHNREVRLFYLARGWTVNQSVKGRGAFDYDELIFRDEIESPEATTDGTGW